MFCTSGDYRKIKITLPMRVGGVGGVGGIAASVVINIITLQPGF